MALGTTNITTTLVGNTIGVASRDVGTLCSSSLINKWSKYKPVIYPAITTDGITNWWKAVDGSCGLSIPEYLNIDNLLTAITNGAIWNYNKPTGGSSSPYRLGDFRGYEHSASKPYKNITIPSSAYNGLTGSQIGASIIVPNDSSNIELRISDLDTIKDCYLGLYITNGTYSQWMTSTLSISNGSASISMPIYGIPTGTYYAYPFLCSISKAINGDAGGAVFYPFDGVDRKQIVIKNNPITVSITALWRGLDPNSDVVEYTVTINNESGDTLNLLNCTTKLKFSNNSYESLLVSGESQTDHGTIQILPNSSYSFSGSYQADHTVLGGWKFWFGSNSPYNLLYSTNVLTPT